MGQHQRRAVSYARDMSVKTNKFVEFDRLIREAKELAADTVLVQSPQVLGDNYDELIDNLTKLANAELALVIVPSEHRR